MKSDYYNFSCYNYNIIVIFKFMIIICIIVGLATSLVYMVVEHLQVLLWG